MIHINLNMIFYTHVKHSPTKTIYIKYYLIIIIIIKCTVSESFFATVRIFCKCWQCRIMDLLMGAFVQVTTKGETEERKRKETKGKKTVPDSAVVPH